MAFSNAWLYGMAAKARYSIAVDKGTGQTCLQVSDWKRNPPFRCRILLKNLHLWLRLRHLLHSPLTPIYLRTAFNYPPLLQEKTVWIFQTCSRGSMNLERF